MYRAVLAVALLTVSALTAFAAPRPSWPSKPIEVSLQHSRGHARTIEVEIAGARHTMLFDTGGGVTAISPALARELGCATTGNSVGLRMTGDRVDTPLCRDIELRVGGQLLHTEAAVIDIAAMLPKDASKVDGMISLSTLDGLAVSLDLAHDKLWLESKRSLAARTKKATPLAFRRATGIGGGQLSPFVGVTTAGGTVWLEVDSGHGATTFVTPNAGKLLGLSDVAATSGELDLQLSSVLSARVPVVVRKDLVLDGVLSSATVARAIWTFDLRSDALWVGAITPILVLPAAAVRPVTPPTTDPTGIYEISLVVGGAPAPHVLRVSRDGNRLVAEMRGIGEDEVVRIDEVKLEGSTLTIVLPLRQPAPMRITFDGVEGKGTWGDPKARGGAVTATKRS
jgi:hypothetical protein